MAEVNFFHVEQGTLDESLPEMLERTLEKQLRAIVIVCSMERSEALTKYLWTYRADSFLPHGNSKDGDAENQPIWITHHDERPNQAEVLFLLDGMQSSRMHEYVRVCDLFDGRTPTSVKDARVRYKAAQAGGHSTRYWKQGPRGWEKKK